jgi:hypothetical protein
MKEILEPFVTQFKALNKDRPRLSPFAQFRKQDLLSILTNFEKL